MKVKKIKTKQTIVFIFFIPSSKSLAHVKTIKNVCRFFLNERRQNCNCNSELVLDNLYHKSLYRYTFRNHFADVFLFSPTAHLDGVFHPEIRQVFGKRAKERSGIWVWRQRCINILLKKKVDFLLFFQEYKFNDYFSYLDAY